MPRRLPLLFLATIGLQSCKGIFGSKNDDQVNDVFTQGRIDPNLKSSAVGYVPVLPFLQGFIQPVDVYVGYDEMLYVVDAVGLRVCDLTGSIQRTIPLRGATKVVQDKRLHVYVAARVDYAYEGITYDLPAVFQFNNTFGAGDVQRVDTIVHPFADFTRANTVTPSRLLQEQAVAFTGITTFADNRLAVARSGTKNNPAGIATPDNAVLFFDGKGKNIGSANGLNATGSSLRSILRPTGIASLVAPPQSLYGVNTTHDFLLTMRDSLAEYKVLWIKESYNPDAGTEYVENPTLLNFDTTKAKGFLYRSFRFKRPTDVAVAPDQTGYIFVVDAAADSLFVFNRSGYEGVIPPAASGQTKQANVSFGGRGSGPFQFNEPTGVAYFRKVVYVADKNNNRVVRFKLSTDLQ